LPECFGQTTADGAHAPENQAQTDQLFRAPAICQITAGGLQQNVAEKKDARRLAFHSVVHEQVVHHGGDFRVQRERDVRAIHIGDRVHDERGGDDAQPALVCHGGMVCEQGARRYLKFMAAG
jgi:hypothetical protein